MKSRDQRNIFYSHQTWQKNQTTVHRQEKRPWPSAAPTLSSRASSCRRCPQCVLVSNSECAHNFVRLTRKVHGVPSTKTVQLIWKGNTNVRCCPREEYSKITTSSQSTTQQFSLYFLRQNITQLICSAAVF